MRTTKAPPPATLDLGSMPPLASVANARGSVRWDAESAAYLLQADRVQYRVFIGAPDEQSSLLRIDARFSDDREWEPLVRCAGMLFREAEGAILPPDQAAERCVLSGLRHSLRGRIISIRYAEDVPGEDATGEAEATETVTLKRTVEIRQVGESLEIRVDAPGSHTAQGYCGFSLGSIGPEGCREVMILGLTDPLYIVEPDGFAAGYVDQFRGQASSYTNGTAFYRTDTTDRTLPISEVFYVTLSTEPLGPLPQIKRNPASFRDRLSRRVTFDWYSEAPYEDDALCFRRLAEYGFQDVLLIYRNWQHFGYQRRQPLLYPANSERGTNETFRQMLEDAARAGWSVAVREEYATIAPDSPYWDEQVVPVWPDGLPRRARNGEPAITAHRMLEFARLESTKIQRNYQVTASFVDGHTALSPELAFRQVDSRPDSESNTEAKAIQQVEQLLQFLRTTHEGPVIGSGGEGPARFDTLSAGMAEGVIRGPEGGARGVLPLDYELREVRPRVIGIGAGSYPQFSTAGPAEQLEFTTEEADWYRATTLALGHTGYVSNFGLKLPPGGPSPLGGSSSVAARDYYLFRALQELYTDAALKHVLYEHNGELLEFRDVLLRNLDLVNLRVHIEYGNGLQLWINRARQGNWTVRANEEDFVLPPSGFVAIASKQKLKVFSALINQQRVDYCKNASYTFLDTRSSQSRRVDDLSVDGGVALLKSAVAGRQDVVFINSRQVTLGDQEYRLSERADVRLRHLSPDELEVVVLDSESGKPIHIQWPTFTAAWKTAKFSVFEAEGEEWRPSKSPVAVVRTGPQLSRARVGCTYRIRV